MNALRVSVLLALTVIAPVPALAQAPPAPPTDSARLQGTWSMLSGAADGYPLPPEYVRGMQRVARASQLTVTMNGSLYFTANYSLDSTQLPKTIDYRMTGGPSAGAVQLGIYAIMGDTARFCFGRPGAPRPAEFATTPGDGRTLATWVRTAP